MGPHKIIFWGVDAQVDFMLPGGNLYVPGAEKRIPNIKRLVEAAAEKHVFLVSSADAHTIDDPEFQLFPPHCVKGTPGARIIPEGLAKSSLTIPNDASFHLPGDILEYPQVILEKQTLDVFNNPQASALVERIGSDAEYVVFGVVTELCVRCAATGLLNRGRKISVVEDAIEAIDTEQARRTLEELQARGAQRITTDEALDKIEAVSRRAAVRESARP